MREGRTGEEEVRFFVSGCINRKTLRVLEMEKYAFIGCGGRRIMEDLTALVLFLISAGLVMLWPFVV